MAIEHASELKKKCCEKGIQKNPLNHGISYGGRRNGGSGGNWYCGRWVGGSANVREGVHTNCVVITNQGRVKRRYPKKVVII